MLPLNFCPRTAKCRPSGEGTPQVRSCAGQRWLTNSKDRAAWDQFSEAGRKLGWHVPIKPDLPGKSAPLTKNNCCDNDRDIAISITFAGVMFCVSERRSIMRRNL